MLCLANPDTAITQRASPNTAWLNEPKTATDWFVEKFPDQVRTYGSPFLEERTRTQTGTTSSTPVVFNTDCLAACLGGDQRLGHTVIYYTEELQFYYYDPRDQMYHSTTPEKMGNLLRALLARCASEVPGEAHIFNLFSTFRTDAAVKSVVNRAKSILAAETSFFAVNSPHQRVNGPELHQRLALVFAEKLLEPCPNSMLTVGQTYALFTAFTKQRDMPVMKRSSFKSMMADVIRDAYGLGVRNDLVNPETQKQMCGWKGLRPAAA